MERRLGTALARQLRSAMSDAELKLWKRLRGRGLLGYKFRRQMPIGRFVADFACIDARLVAELDGGQHVDRTEQDALRTLALGEAGYRVLRFWNDDVLLRLDVVLEQILAALGDLETGGSS